MNFKLESGAGNHFHSVSQKAKSIATEKNFIVEFEFNGVICLVNAWTNLDHLYRDYSNAFGMEWEFVGPNCLEEYDEETKKEIKKRLIQREEEQEARRKELALQDEAERVALSEKLQGIQLEVIPDKAAAYAEHVAKNSKDGYSRAVVDYSEAWGKKMQKAMKDTGKPLSEIAGESENGLGFLGITGFQYGCAVNTLSIFWVHGEELRQWHNEKYGFSKEKKGVVNPAILTLKD